MSVSSTRVWLHVRNKSMRHKRLQTDSDELESCVRGIGYLCWMVTSVAPRGRHSPMDLRIKRSAEAQRRSSNLRLPMFFAYTAPKLFGPLGVALTPAPVSTRNILFVVKSLRFRKWQLVDSRVSCAAMKNHVPGFPLFYLPICTPDYISC